MPVFNPAIYVRRMFADWLAHQQRLRSRKLHVVRLEDRRLPDASFALVAGVLTLDGFDAGDQLNMDFDGTTDEFHFDLQSGQWDAADVAGGPFTLSNGDQTLSVGVSSLDAIHVDASAAPLAAITDGANGLATNTLQILGGGAVTLDSTSNDFGTISVQADSLTLHDSNALQMDDVDVTGSVTINAVGSIDDTIGSAINVGGLAGLSAGSIVLGEGAGDVVNFGTLTVNASGDVTITEDSQTDLAGSNTADLFTVTSLSHMDVAGTLTANEVHVASGGILSGGGFVDASVTTDSGSHIESPISPDELSTQDFSLNAGASLDAVLGGSDMTPLNSRLNVTGTVTLAGDLTLSIDPLLIPVDGTEFELISNDGMDAVSGSFAGLNEGNTVTVGGRTFVISYSGGDGNDVSLFAGVPVYDFANAAFVVTETDTGILVSNAVLLNRSGNTAVASSVDITIAAHSTNAMSSASEG